MISGQKIKDVSSTLGEAVRLLGASLVLRPAAWLLPRRLALLAADAIALILAVMPEPGFKVMHEMQRAFGVRRTAAFRLAWGWLAQPLRDFVVCRRMILGRETENLRVVEKNAESIRLLRNSGESYIIAISHVGREAGINLFWPQITPGHILDVFGSLPLDRGITYKSWVRLIFAAASEAVNIVHGGNLTLVTVGSTPPAAATLYANLCRPGNVCVIAIDAYWKNKGPGFFERPFAGLKSHRFSLGAIGLARMAQCAIIGCVYWREKDGTIVLDWGDPVRPAPRGTRAEDISIMNELLDRLEVAFGNNPTQCLRRFYGQRRWDPHLKRWQDP